MLADHYCALNIKLPFKLKVYNRLIRPTYSSKTSTFQKIDEKEFRWFEEKNTEKYSLDQSVNRTPAEESEQTCNKSSHNAHNVSFTKSQRIRWLV